jgi:murein DD-endopeptidase MepM/ murein hydrolase activator NlpD
MRYQHYYPVKPSVVSRAWGVRPIDPKTGQSEYKPFGFLDHNGKDRTGPIGNNVRYPLPGMGKVIRAATKANGQWQPQGGGQFVSIVTLDEYAFDDGKNCHVLLDYLHFSKVSVELGDVVRLGDILGEIGVTGYTTGPHTHEQARRVDIVPIPDGTNVSTVNSYRIFPFNNYLIDVDRNDANNSFDTTRYENGKYAYDALGLVARIISSLTNNK